jgi:hypothetical protein
MVKGFAAPVAQVEAALTELGSRGVFSRTDAGAIYSRRMVGLQAVGAELGNGKKGGNPKIRLKRADNPEVKREVKPAPPGLKPAPPWA